MYFFFSFLLINTSALLILPLSCHGVVLTSVWFVPQMQGTKRRTPVKMKSGEKMATRWTSQSSRCLIKSFAALWCGTETRWRSCSGTPALPCILWRPSRSSGCESGQGFLRQMSTCLCFFVFFLHPPHALYSCYFDMMINRKPELLKGVYNMGFNRPSRIQENALPMMLAQPWVQVYSFRVEMTQVKSNHQLIYYLKAKSCIKEKHQAIC